MAINGHFIASTCDLPWGMIALRNATSVGHLDFNQFTETVGAVIVDIIAESFRVMCSVGIVCGGDAPFDGAETF